MNRTKIEYLDFTLNPITGCSGEGCAVRKHCWALAMSKRLAGRYGYPKENPFEPTFHEDKIYEPVKFNKPSRIGLCFMGDFFDKKVRPEWQAKVHSMITSAWWHKFLILTKQPQNIPTWISYPPNLWIGVSVNVRKDLWRIHELKKRTNIHIKAVSFEPLLQHIKVNLDGIDWIIIGAQTRPNKQPELWWVEELFNEAFYKNIPIFLKDNLECKEFFGSLEEFPE